MPGLISSGISVYKRRVLNLSSVEISLEMIGASNIVLMFYLNQLAVYWVVLLTDLKVSGMSDSVHLIKCTRQVLEFYVCL